MIPLTVIVGIGGQGSAIAKGVHERLIDFAEQHPDAYAERQLVERSVRLFAIDTVRHPDIETGFSAGNYKILNPGSPDDTVMQRSGFDRDWWPAHIDQVGAFDKGAGMMRAKGRLAYRLQGHGLAARIVEYVTELRGVRADADAGLGTVQPAYVFIVGSLSGGTGSGILLTLAMHLRQLLDPNTKIIGAIPLASIMELGPARDFRQTIWANCSAGLREIEWWLLPPNLRPRQIRPFFQVGTEVIGGDGREGKASTPFNFCYLFTRKNRAGQALDDFETYTQLIADCIALDLYSPISNASQQSFSNDLQFLLPTTRPPDSDDPKPIIFGGAGAAALVYPTYAIASYLGARLLSSVLETKLLPEIDLGTQPQDWLVEHRLENRAPNRHVRTSLKRDIIDPNTSEKRQFPTRPNPSNLDDARKDEVRGIIERAAQDFDDNAQLRSGSWIQRVSSHVADNRRILAREQRQAIAAEISNRLTATSGDGFPDALAFARRVRIILKLNADAEDAEITNRDGGLRVRRARLDEELHPQDSRRATPSAIEQIREDWGFGPWANGSGAKENFVNTWWNPYVDVREQIVLAEAAKGLYDELLRWLDGVIDLLEVVRADLADAAARTREDARVQLGARRPGQLVFEESVLAHPRMVDYVFGGLYNRRADPTGTDASTLAGTLVEGIQQILGQFDSAHERESWLSTPEARARAVHERMDAVRDEVRRDARARFEGDVERLSLWQALDQEFHFRVRNQMIDDHLAQLGLSQTSSTPTGRDLETLCDRYILRRVKQCVDAALPFWDLDNARKGRFEAQFPVRRSGIVAFDGTLFEQSNGRMELMRNQIGDICRAAGFSIETRDQSAHRLYATSRELGAPLFLLADAERRMLTAEEAAYTSARGPAYIDERYTAVLPPSIEFAAGKGLPSGQREMFDLGLAFGLGYMRPANGTVDGEIQATTNLAPPNWQRYSADLAEALERTQTDESARRRLRDLIEESWVTLSPGDQRRLLELGRDWIRGELHASRDRDGFGAPSAVTQSLEQMLQAFDQSMDVLV
jgi:hypothetical protein